MPRRIQRKRTKGWKLPPKTVCVSRPSRWGNPFNWREGVENGNEAWAKGVAVSLFSRWLRRPEEFPGTPKPPSREQIRDALRGKNLACYCRTGEPCHADVLLEIANGAQ